MIQILAPSGSKSGFLLSVRNKTDKTDRVSVLHQMSNFNPVTKLLQKLSDLYAFSICICHTLLIGSGYEQRGGEPDDRIP